MAVLILLMLVLKSVLILLMLWLIGCINTVNATADSIYAQLQFNEFQSYWKLFE